MHITGTLFLFTLALRYAYTISAIHIKMSKYYCAVVICYVLLVLCFGAACSPTAVSPDETTATSTDLKSLTASEETSIAALAEGNVTRVLDETAIEANINGQLHVIRYIGVAVPAPFHLDDAKEYYSKEAYKKNYDLVNGKTIYLEKDVSETDKRGSLLRYVWVNDTMINAELIRQGYAQVIPCPPDRKYYNLFVKLQIEAQHEGKGLWSLEDELDNTAPIPGTFIGNIKSKTYHYSSCALVVLISDQYRLAFASVASALARGYKPCTICKPPAKLCNQGTCQK